MAEQYTYAVARIRALENSLMDRQDLEQLLYAPNLETALQQLADGGFGGETQEPSIESILQAERDRLWGQIRALVPGDKAIQIFQFGVDYHNIKAAVKALLTGASLEGLFLDNGTVSAEKIIHAIKKREYGQLPPHLGETAQHAVEVLLQTRDGQECDLVVDCAAMRHMVHTGRNSGIPFVQQYMELAVALTNLKIAVRGCRTEKGAAFLRRAMEPCGTLDVEQLAAAAAKGQEALCAYLSYTSYAEAVEELKQSMSAFEKWSDNKIMELVRQQKSNLFTIAPILAYLLAKENEIKSVRMILTAKQNHIASETIRERLRDMYV